MEERKLSSWEDFEREIGEVFSRYSKKRKEALGGVSAPLFRGHTMASWSLKTTLERYAGGPYTMREYWEVMRNFVKSPVESMTERRWDIGEYPKEGPEPYGPPLGYEFMVYLRHHGFPSRFSTGRNRLMSPPSLRSVFLRAWIGKSTPTLTLPSTITRSIGRGGRVGARTNLTSSGLDQT
jgi:hypothetical protein